MKKEILKNMAHMTYGIYVLTTRFENAINGMIASWVSQVSYDPPLLMAAIHANRYSHELLVQSGHFALHILSREQKDLLARFKGPLAGEKFESIAWEEGVTGCPILADCIGCMECRITQSLAPGNHLATTRLAWIQYNLGRFAEAERTYRDVLTRYPSDLEMQAGLGWALLKQGRKTEAANLFQAILALSPEYATAKTGLAAAR